MEVCHRVAYGRRTETVARMTQKPLIHVLMAAFYCSLQKLTSG